MRDCHLYFAVFSVITQHVRAVFTRLSKGIRICFVFAFLRSVIKLA